MQTAADLTYNQAMAVLDIKYSHLMRLLREKVLARTQPGSVSDSSVQAFLASNRPPEGYVTAAAAASHLGIARNRIPWLVDKGLVRGVALPNALCGTWIHHDDLLHLDIKAVAQLGIKIAPPIGWTTSADACKRLRVNRSGLRSLVQQGLVESMPLSPMNTFYSETSIRRSTAP